MVCQFEGLLTRNQRFRFYPVRVTEERYHRQQNNLSKAKKEFPHVTKVHSQVLQTTIRRLHDAWDAFQERGFGFLRFKKYGQFKSFVFPQFKANPIEGLASNRPRLDASQLICKTVGSVHIGIMQPLRWCCYMDWIKSHGQSVKGNSLRESICKGESLGKRR